MSSSADVTQALLTTLVSLQGSVGKPSEEVCRQIAALQGLAEVNRNSAGGDWRRGTVAPSEESPKWRRQGPQHRQQPQGQGQLQQQGQQSPVGKYQSRFRNSTHPVEEKILNNIILSKLNKFSEGTYNDVRDFLYQILGSGDADLQEFVRDFMRLVFRKAASEEIFCPLYSRLLAEISAKYSVIIDEMKILSENYLEIFEEVTEETGVDYDTFVRKNTEKKYRLGYSQFLAELGKQEILPLPNLTATFSKLIDLLQQAAKQPEKTILVEEYTDCILRMTRVFKKKMTPFSRTARETLLGTFVPFYTELQQKKELFPSCSSKSRFILMDVSDILHGV
jgi:hypothetical protein